MVSSLPRQPGLTVQILWLTLSGSAVSFEGLCIAEWSLVSTCSASLFIEGRSQHGILDLGISMS